MRKSIARSAALGRTLAILGVASSLASSEARACGGLFCSGAAGGVNQAAERIVFAHDESAGRVTAVIEILYQGPADRFAWILPVPGTPEVGVSTSALLNRLQQATNPQYQVRGNWDGLNCQTCLMNPLEFDCDQADVAVSGPSNGGEGGVSVVASGNAGPYDYEVISVAQAPGEDPAQAAIEWLTENQYDISATTPVLLRPYLMNGMNLLAVRLDKEASVGSIRPIKIAYDSDEPMIPIKPTAVAANDDMGVLVWVLGSARAVPYNYKSLELNEALIDWFNPQQSYNDVIIAAANETGDGQGFVTEQARLTTDPQLGSIADQIFREQFAISSYRSSADELTDAKLLSTVIEQFVTFGSFSFAGPFAGATPSGQVALDGVADALAGNLTIPQGFSVADVMSVPRCFFDEIQTPRAFYCAELPELEAAIDLTDFDRIRFMTDVEELVIEPIEETVRLFGDLPYMTRFYTTLSADEMTVDPAFVINADLSDVSNQHTLAIQYEDCSPNLDGPWSARFGDAVVRGRGSVWPLTIAERPDDMPVNRRVLQLAASGRGEVYEDNGDVIGQLLGTQFGTPPEIEDAPSMTPGMNPPRGDDPMNPLGSMGSSGGCSVGRAPGGSTAAAATAGLLTLALLGASRRSRPRFA